MTARTRRTRRIDFAGISAAALRHADVLVPRWLPDGERQGVEWVSRNPKRTDRTLGSFCVNLRSGKWGDFAVAGARGGDLISLGAFLFDLSQADAARRLAAALGINAERRDAA